MIRTSEKVKFEGKKELVFHNDRNKRVIVEKIDKNPKIVILNDQKIVEAQSTEIDGGGRDERYENEGQGQEELDKELLKVLNTPDEPEKDEMEIDIEVIAVDDSPVKEAQKPVERNIIIPAVRARANFGLPP
jgi:hypothetical protein